jgi:hypothetical protein
MNALSFFTVGLNSGTRKGIVINKHSEHEQN